MKQEISRGALSVAQFCESHDISRPTFYKLVAEGRAPKTMKIRRRTLVSVESAAEWRARMTRETQLDGQ